MKKLIVFFFSIANLFYGQTTVVNWATIVNNATGVVNTSSTPNAVVTISGSGFSTTSGASPRYNTGGSGNWGMNGLGLGVNWSNLTTSVTIDIAFTIPVCGDLSFIVHDLNGDYGSFPFEDKIIVNGYDQNSTLIPVNATNYSWTSCSGGTCGGIALYTAGAGGAGQSNMKLGRGTNGCSVPNVYGCSSNQTTFTLKSPTAPNKIKRVTIVYTSGKGSSPDVNGYITGGDPAYQNIVISNVTAKMPPTVNLSTGCTAGASLPVIQAVVTGTTGSPTYLWTGGTGISSSTALTTSVNAAPSTNTTYTFTATNGAPSAGCTQTAAIQVNAVNCSLLPIELISFNANRKSGIVNLNWKTASEKNNDYFSVERSLDGFNFEEIEKIKGAADSYKILSYDAIDENPLNEISYYRLKQVDFNGQMRYSDIVSVDADNSKATIGNIAPNPTASSVNFDFYTSVTGELNYEIMDLTGRVLISKSQLLENGYTKLSVLMNDLPNGIYFLKATFDKTSLVSVNKIIKN